MKENVKSKLNKWIKRLLKHGEIPNKHIVGWKFKEIKEKK